MDVFFCGGMPSGDENPEGEISDTPNLKAKRLRFGEVELMQGA